MSQSPTDRAKTPVKRADFIKQYMKSGFTYTESITAYETMLQVIEDAVVNGSPIYLGKLGVLEPRVLPPRTVTMGFRRSQEGMTKERREYVLGARLKYTLKIYRSFMERSSIKWWISS